MKFLGEASQRAFHPHQRACTLAPSQTRAQSVSPFPLPQHTVDVGPSLCSKVKRQAQTQHQPHLCSNVQSVADKSNRPTYRQDCACSQRLHTTPVYWGQE